MLFRKSILILSTVSFLLFANEEIIKNINQSLKEIENIATITKVNEPYQPYIISTFKGKDLEKLGISNLKEALELIPGVDIATDNIDNKTAIFRGSNPFAYGQSKLIVDGVEVNNIFFDSYNSFLYMPIEIIKRIEVIRGPGSKSDGINAYAGSIRVYTYAEHFKDLEKSYKNRVFLKAGSYDYKGAGFTKGYQNGDLDIFTDFYYQKDDKFISSGYDILSTGIYGDYNKQFSQNKKAPLWMDNYSLGITLNYKDFILKARHIYYQHGSAYGINYMLPQDKDHTKFLNSFLELGLKKDLDNFKIDTKVGVKFDSFYSNARLAPPGITVPNPLDNNNLVEYKNGFFGIHEAKQREFYHSLFLNFNRYKNHNIKAGYIISRKETYKVVTKTTDRFGVLPGLVDYSQTYPFFDKNAKRDSLILSLRDDYNLNDDLTLRYGVNFEKSTHIDPQFNPRVALVYVNSDNIYKFIYSRSIRDPSWQELYTMNNSARKGNLNLKPETVNAFEVAYIKRLSIDNYFQFNLFYLLNKDQIKLNSQKRYENLADTYIYGFEMEYKTLIGQKSRFYGNYSFVTGRNSQFNYIPNVARHMLKAFYIYELNPELNLNLIGKYVGDKKRLPSDNRDKLKSWATLDLGFNYKSFKNGFDINFIVKNIFDADVRYPSEPYTYMEDYRQEGRGFMISFRKDF